jgi:photosystem II stability/assembly factor-like uncharacterized protein
MKKLLMFLVTLFVVTALVFGQTWEVKKESLDIPVFSDAFFLDANTGWLVEFRGDVGIVVASSGHIYTTSPTAVANGDSLVEVFVEPDGDDFYDVEFINDFLVYVVGENGKIYKSVDAGENWTQEISPTTETLDKVRIVMKDYLQLGKVVLFYLIIWVH